MVCKNIFIKDFPPLKSFSDYVPGEAHFNHDRDFFSIHLIIGTEVFTSTESTFPGIHWRTQLRRKMEELICQDAPQFEMSWDLKQNLQETQMVFQFCVGIESSVFAEDFAFSKFSHTPRINSTSLVEFQRTHQLRKYFDLLGEKLGIQKLDDWYQISHLEAIEVSFIYSRCSHVKHGAGLYLVEFENSLIKSLMSIYPEHHWKPWKFENIDK